MGLIDNINAGFDVCRPDFLGAIYPVFDQFGYCPEVTIIEVMTTIAGVIIMVRFTPATILRLGQG